MQRALRLLPRLSENICQNIVLKASDILKSRCYHRSGFFPSKASSTPQKTTVTNRQSAQNAAAAAFLANRNGIEHVENRAQTQHARDNENNENIRPTKDHRLMTRLPVAQNGRRADLDQREKMWRQQHNQLYDILKQVQFHFMIFGGMFAVPPKTDDAGSTTSGPTEQCADGASASPVSSEYCTCDDDDIPKPNATDTNKSSQVVVEKKRFRGVLQFCRGPHMVVPHAPPDGEPGKC